MSELLWKTQLAYSNVDRIAFEVLDPSDSDVHISTKCTCVITCIHAFSNRTKSDYATFGMRCIFTRIYTYVYIRVPASGIYHRNLYQTESGMLCLIWIWLRRAQQENVEIRNVYHWYCSKVNRWPYHVTSAEKKACIFYGMAQSLPSHAIPFLTELDWE